MTIKIGKRRRLKLVLPSKEDEETSSMQLGLIIKTECLHFLQE